MDFSKFKNKALELKDSAVSKTQDAISFGAGKLADSKFTLKNTQELENFIKRSENTESLDKKTQQKKTHIRKVIVIFAEPEGEFFKDLLYLLPVLSAKAFSQNISLKLADAGMDGFQKKNYKIKALPSLVVFENTKVIKTLEGEEKIQKVVKTLDLDINTVIEEME